MGQHIRKIKGGSKIVEAIVTEWKVQYRNRPAMMDELSNYSINIVYACDEAES